MHLRTNLTGTLSSQIILSAEKISPCTSVFELLENRKGKENQMKELHVNRAEMERYCDRFRNSFFDQLNLFHQLIENESILTKLASAISEIRLIRPEEKLQEIDLKSLHAKDRSIVKKAFELFTKKSEGYKVNLTRWISFRRQIGQRVENKVIVAWSLRFHHPLEAILSDSLPFEEGRFECGCKLDPDVR